MAGLDRWRAIASAWAAGETPAGFSSLATPPAPQPRDVFLPVIIGAQRRNPAAPLTLTERL